MVMMLSLKPPIVYPSTKRGRVRRWPHATPRAGTFARAGKNKLPERFGRRLAYDAQQGAWGGCGVVTCGRRPIQKMPTKKPAADFSARAFEDFCDDDAMPVICPTCQSRISPFAKWTRRRAKCPYGPSMSLSPSPGRKQLQKPVFIIGRPAAH